MADRGAIGLSRRELEYEVRWRMRHAPTDPARVHEFLAEMMVDLIEKNNAAVAASLAERDRVDMPEDG